MFLFSLFHDLLRAVFLFGSFRLGCCFFEMCLQHLDLRAEIFSLYLRIDVSELVAIFLVLFQLIDSFLNHLAAQSDKLGLRDIVFIILFVLVSANKAKLFRSSFFLFDFTATLRDNAPLETSRASKPCH